MKQIILDSLILPVEKIDSTAYSIANSNKDIVVYLTAAETGVAILKYRHGFYGFVYHKDLITRNNITDGNCKYTSNSISRSIEKALVAGRAVFLFYNFEEFTKFAAEHTQHKL